jgi:hypothetical protein
MNTQTLTASIALAATLGLAGCATLNVRTDSDPALLSSRQCHSVAWMVSAGARSTPRAAAAPADSSAPPPAATSTAPPARNVATTNPLNESRLRDAIAANLQAAGMTLTDRADQADCLVGYGVGVQLTAEPAYPTWGGSWGGYYGYGWGAPGLAFRGRRGAIGLGAGWGWGLGWGGGWGGRWSPQIYRHTIIGIALYDGKSHKPMWRATTTRNLEGLSGDAATQNIHAAIDAIFAKFPR